MQDQQARLQSIVSQGWLILAVFLLLLTFSDIMQAAIKTDFTEFATHPGPEGWAMIGIATGVYLALSLGTRIVDAVWYRWLNVVLLTYVTLYSIWHHIEHVLDKDKGYGIYGVVDVTQYLVSAVLIYLAFRWARSGKRV